jgi:hypothetical protein
LLQKQTSVLNKLTIFFISFYTLAVFSTAAINYIIEYVTLVTFFLLGVGFLITGVMMLRSLKNHFPIFYKKMGCPIFAATLLLAIPLEIRACNWFL